MKDNTDIAKENSFRVIILGEDWGDILISEEPYFAHVPTKRFPSMRDINNLIEYFKLKKDLDKCAALQRYIEENPTQ